MSLLNEVLHDREFGEQKFLDECVALCNNLVDRGVEVWAEGDSGQECDAGAGTTEREGYFVRVVADAKLSQALDGRCIQAIIWFDKIVIGGATRLSGRTLSTVDSSGWVSIFGDKGRVTEAERDVDSKLRSMPQDKLALFIGLAT